MRYMSKATLASDYEISKRFVDKLVAEILESGRYPDDVVLRDTGYLRVNEDDFRDYMNNRRLLRNETTRRLVKEYERRGYGTSG